MFAAVSLGVFDKLATGKKSCPALAKAMKLNPDALERLLDACVGLKLLSYREGFYENTPVAAAYLCSKSPLRLTGYVNSSNSIFWKLWEHLEGAIKEGTNRWKQAFGLDGNYWDHIFRTEHDKTEFLIGMHGYGQITSPSLVKAFDLSRYETLVDLGGGTGHFAIAACQHYPELRAKVFEVAEAIPLAVQTVNESPVRDRIEVVEGDFFRDDLPEADLYCLARILHDWPEEKILTLLRKIFDRLKPEGALLIAEKLLFDDKTGPYWAQMQNLNMLVLAEGKERTFDQYRVLLNQVGFVDVKAAVTDSPLDCIRAEKQRAPKEKPSIKPIVDEPRPIATQDSRQRPPFADEAAMYSAFFEKADVGFVISDMDGKFLLVNEAFARVLNRGVRETLLINYRTITPEAYADEDAEQMKILFKNKSFGPFDKQYIRKDGSLVSVRVMLKLIPLRDKECIWASVEKVSDQAGIHSKGGRVVEYLT